jgi:hypothetical protein
VFSETILKTRSISAILLSSLLFTVLGACTSSEASRQAVLVAEQEAELAAGVLREATQREEQARQTLLREQIEREARVAQEARERQERAQHENLLRLEEEQQQVEARRQQQALAAQQRAQVERAAALERELSAAQSRIRTQAEINARLQEAIAAAEELLQTLTAEQARYENLDETGQPREPLQRARIQELEARKNALIRATDAPLH